jgi:GAF domain-containing protein
MRRSRPLGDVQPMLAAIAKTAARLCDANDAVIRLVEGDQTRLVARYGRLGTFRNLGETSPLTADLVVHRAIVERRTIHVRDLAKTPRTRFVDSKARHLPRGRRTMLATPLLRDGAAIGAIFIRRTKVRPFTPKQIALLKTFADQAAIAIENARLSQALEARNADLTDALDRETATAEILRSISQAQADVQPVFEVIAESAMRLFEAWSAGVFRYEDGLIRLAAARGGLPGSSESFMEQLQAPWRPTDDAPRDRAVLSRAVQHVVDVETDPSCGPRFREQARLRGFRSSVAVPMLRGEDVVGVIAITRSPVGGFAPAEIALLQTFADQAVIAIENARLLSELQAKNADLTEALEQQTATSEILRVISQSPTDVQPVFDIIGERAERLCAADVSIVSRFDGELIQLVALHGVAQEGVEVVRGAFPMRSNDETVTARAFRNRSVVHIPDVLADPLYQTKDAARAGGYRGCLGVPMVREGQVIGVIFVARTTPGYFADTQVELLKTFADQAVIAVENVRLFKELQARNRELTAALEQQTATSEILGVISSSPTEVQPVFDAIVGSAARLCEAEFSAVARFEGGLLHLAAISNMSPGEIEAYHSLFPRPAHRSFIIGRAFVDGRPVHVEDVRVDPDYDPRTLEVLQRAAPYRTFLGVPIIRNGVPIGAIGCGRREVKPFTETQIELVKTFADQAVIAIENVRLFKELEARNRDLTVALEQQTATSEILRVISSSQTDVKPVFDTIVRSAMTLCDGLFSALFQFDGELIHQVAQHNYTPEALEAVRRIYPARPSRALGAARAILDRAVVHMPDNELDPEFQHQVVARAIGFRSGLFVPMLREGAPIGVIMVARAEPGPFSDNEIELLKTFADQAVIAVENVRLFKELEARTGELTRSVEQLTALGEVSQALSSTLDVETVLNTIVSHASQLAGAAGCSIYEYDEAAEQFELRATHNYEAEYVEALRAARFRKGEGLMGRATEMREPAQIPDITQPGAYQSSIRETLIRFGYRAILSVPLLREEQIIGSLSLTRKAPGEYSPEVIEVLKTFATQSALAIQNARLFREIADKSRQLEVASRHKSEFLANMSHELRTPLNAIIGFSEVLNERMFGDLNDKQAEYLKDIHASGQHLLSLINDILDLSKIEAGRMELELTDFDLPAAVDNAVTLVRERASRKGVKVRVAVEEQVGAIRGDERKIRQVLLNLLSNAIKFTPEGGRIEVGAALGDGAVEVSVSDTGVGIAPEDQEAVFEEFRQVGASAAKQEGTGLGLALCRKFIELHGGKIWVSSALGSGSTFTFRLPRSS